MRTSLQAVIALGCAAFLVAAGYAMRGEHVPTGNVGHLGHEAAGVLGTSPGGDGVSGQGFTGVYGSSSNADGTGVWGETTGTTPDAVGVYGAAPNTSWAGYFNGHLGTSGTLVNAAGSFRIDHPLDPHNKYLSHSFVESPDMMNLYSGTVTLDGEGSAIVQLPDWFEALNRDFRYQLTCIGESAPVYIAEEIANNRFRIAGGHGSMRVSWQVIGARRDAYAVWNPIVVESWKGARERGRLLHPEAYGMAKTMSIAADRERRSAPSIRRAAVPRGE